MPDDISDRRHQPVTGTTKQNSPPPEGSREHMFQRQRRAELLMDRHGKHGHYDRYHAHELDEDIE